MGRKALPPYLRSKMTEAGKSMEDLYKIKIEWILLKGSVHQMGPSRIWMFFIPLESAPKINKKN